VPESINTHVDPSACAQRPRAGLQVGGRHVRWAVLFSSGHQVSGQRRLWGAIVGRRRWTSRWGADVSHGGERRTELSFAAKIGRCIPPSTPRSSSVTFAWGSAIDDEDPSSLFRRRGVIISATCVHCRFLGRLADPALLGGHEYTLNRFRHRHA